MNKNSHLINKSQHDITFTTQKELSSVCLKEHV